MTRCAVRSIVSSRGPLEALAASHTYWPGPRAAALCAIVGLDLLAGGAAIEAAATVNNPNANSDFTTNSRLKVALTRFRLPVTFTHSEFADGPGRPYRMVMKRLL